MSGPHARLGRIGCLISRSPAAFASHNPLKWRGPCPIGRAARIRKLSLNSFSAMVESILAYDIGISYLTNRCRADYYVAKAILAVEVSIPLEEVKMLQVKEVEKRSAGTVCDENTSCHAPSCHAPSCHAPACHAPSCHAPGGGK